MTDQITGMDQRFQWLIEKKTVGVRLRNTRLARDSDGYGSTDTVYFKLEGCGPKLLCRIDGSDRWFSDPSGVNEGRAKQALLRLDAACEVCYPLSGAEAMDAAYRDGKKVVSRFAEELHPDDEGWSRHCTYRLSDRSGGLVEDRDGTPNTPSADEYCSKWRIAE